MAEKIVQNPHEIPPNKFKAVGIKKTKEEWSEFHLEDGTIMRLKPVMMEMKKANGYFMPNGEPLYVANISFVFNNKVPARLKMKHKD